MISARPANHFRCPSVRYWLANKAVRDNSARTENYVHRQRCIASDAEGACGEYWKDLDIEENDRGADCRHRSHPEHRGQKHQLLYTCQMGLISIGESLPEGLVLRARRPSVVGLGNSNLEIVTVSVRSLLRLKRFTINTDTGLGECKSLSSSVIGDCGSIRDVLKMLTRPSSVK